MKKQPFSIWLVPRHEDAEILSHAIKELSVRFNAVPFEPHLTLGSGHTIDFQQKVSALQESARLFMPITLGIASIGCSADFFKTLFIQFHENSCLNYIGDTIKTAIAPESTHNLFPHVSLLYADIPLEKKKELSVSFTIMLEHITFDKVKLVYPSNPDRGWFDIQGWKVVFETRIGEKANNPC